MNWNDDGKFSNVEKCPFCGAVLNSEKEQLEEITMGNVLKMIKSKFGEEIFIKDKPRVKSYFKDIAPKLQTECRMLELALLFNIEQCFINILEDKQKEKLNEFVKEAELFLTSDVINTVISAFSDAFGFNNDISNPVRINVKKPGNIANRLKLNSARVNYRELKKIMISDLAKDLSVSENDIVELMWEFSGVKKNPSSTLTEEQVNLVLEYFTQENQVSSLDAYFKQRNRKK